MNCLEKCLVCSTIVLLAATTASGQTRTYTVHDLGTLGGASSKAIAINAAGQVVGNSTTAAGINHAFRTTPNAAIDIATDDLGTLGGAETYAADINQSGQVVGRSMLGSSVFHGFRTAPNAAITQPDDLGTFGGTRSFASGINDWGQATGGADTAADRLHAFITAPNHPIDSMAVDVGLLSPINTYPGINNGVLIPSYGLKINNSANLAVATTPIDTYYPQGFTYINGTLTLFPGIGGYAVFGDINDHNQFVFADDIRTTVWLDGTPVELCTRNCEFLAINNSGQMVGGTRIQGNEVDLISAGGVALFYSGGTIFKLDDLIPAGSGWVLQAATDINDSGQMVGWGTINGQAHAFRLDPPATNTVSGLARLVTSLKVPPRTAQRLHSILRAALASLESGDIHQTRHELNAFEEIVESQTGKKLTADQADQLMTAAEGVIGSLPLIGHKHGHLSSDARAPEERRDRTDGDAGEHQWKPRD
jgi:probable HAF family extracellular repeat protein